ncbi:hypothetical protein [Burkholderia oklahomensis]|uniref:hypothetical protein n=1 Tax=Burkholderia oklahomensis TaxID=342113 RepID=UPI00059D180D|nr:hypothetical protein [Burkholderia oklahomensis]AOI38867.1 hypothetical protein WG70_04040 [Burkholderia oklahomensis EO147]KUY65571.1 hypothetical protein WG70_27490 [Burkholderia oklahomensis EO147]QPS40786.1 hypothetical protein I6G57_21000 [Burkholderia oklahomensis]
MTMRRACAVRRASLAGLTLALALALALVRPGHAARADDGAARGLALFTGAAPLHGRLPTHPGELPAPVVRCANCHAAGAGATVPNSTAPRLTRTWLADLQSRRGGPPSRYDRDAFCALLRTGLDPAYVMINVEMPRYRLSERDCSALWRILNEDPHGRK